MKNLFNLLTSFLVVATISCTNDTTISPSSTNELEGTWVLKSILLGDAVPPLNNVREMNITFSSTKNDSSSIFFGQSSVNTFFGGYNIVSFDNSSKTGKIKMGAIASTKIAGKPELMQLENIYLAILEKSVDFKITTNNDVQKLRLSYSVPAGAVKNEAYDYVLFFERPIPK
jgi:heat shock protein HslJ